jgi:hypothetical protein
MRTSIGELALGTLLVFVIVAVAVPKDSPVSITHAATGAAWVIEKLLAFLFGLITSLLKLPRLL